MCWNLLAWWHFALQNTYIFKISSNSGVIIRPRALIENLGSFLFELRGADDDLDNQKLGYRNQKRVKITLLKCKNIIVPWAQPIYLKLSKRWFCIICSRFIHSKSDIFIRRSKYCKNEPRKVILLLVIDFSLIMDQT